MTFDIAFTAYLDSLSNLGIEPSLGAVEALAAELGKPQNRFPVIQITGTNGKTSTARMVQALLTAHGLRAGLYLSPHLVAYEERIAIDGIEIDAAEFDLVGREVRAAAAAAERGLDGRKITQFEAITAAALKFFADQRVDVAVLEVGMGARWDATSISVPKVGVITTVSMDHAEWLGPTLADIAVEKSYVIKTGNTVVIGEASPEAQEIFAARVEAEGARAYWLGRDFSVLTAADSITVAAPAGTYDQIHLGVAGQWQAQNVAMAITATEAFLARGLRPEKVREALAAVRSPGRAELWPGPPDILLDGAHNQAGVEALASFLGAEFSGRPIVFVISILRDKAAAGMVKELVGISRKLVVTASDNPRCFSPQELAAMVAEAGGRPEIRDNIEQAMRRARDLVEPDALIVITGSLYLVGAARRLLGRAALP